MKIIVIDIGTHKAEEVNILQHRHTFLLKKFWKYLKENRFAMRRMLGDVRKLYLANTRLNNLVIFQFILIEPVLHSEIFTFIKNTRDTTFINGVSSCRPSGDERLYFSGDSLGHSIMKEKPNLLSESKKVCNWNFEGLYKFLLANKLDEDRILLRINAEGVELDIVKFLASLDPNHRPIAIAGSVGDVKKCFGESVYNSLLDTMRESKMPYVYFTSLSSTWAPAVDDLIDIICNL